MKYEVDLNVFRINVFFFMIVVDNFEVFLENLEYVIYLENMIVVVVMWLRDLFDENEKIKFCFLLMKKGEFCLEMLVYL